MAFFDRPDLKPSAFNGIKIQDFDNNGNGLQHGIDGSGEYAMNKNAILCFASNYEWGTNTSKRVVTFKGFIENLKINGKLTREIEENFWNAQVIDYLTSFEISYSLSFNVVTDEPSEPNAVGEPATPPPATVRVEISLFSGMITYWLDALAYPYINILAGG